MQISTGIQLSYLKWKSIDIHWSMQMLWNRKIWSEIRGKETNRRQKRPFNSIGMMCERVRTSQRWLVEKKELKSIAKSVNVIYRLLVTVANID